MLTKGKLRDLLDNARTESPVAMNVLDLPLGRATVPMPPLYNDFATDTHSATLVGHLVDLRDMGNVTSWGTAATKNALSWFHADDEGYSTAVSVQAGSKWWVLARLKKDHARWDEMSSFDTFWKWDVKDIDLNRWDVEAVHLTSTCVL